MADSEEKSVGWVIVALTLAVAWLGWAFMASDYAQLPKKWSSADFDLFDDEHDAALGDFLWNSVVQIPSFFSVVAFALTKRIWLVSIFVCIEVGVYFVGRKMRRLEREFARESR